MANKQLIDIKETDKSKVLDAKKVNLTKQDKILEVTPSTEKLEKGFDPNHPNIINLDKKKEEELEGILHEDIKNSIEDSSDLHTELEKYEMMYACEPDPANENDPWPGGSNARSPFAAISTKSKFVRWMSSIFGIEPYCLIAPLPAEDIEVKDEKSIIMKQGLDSKKELARKIEGWLHFIFDRKMKGVKEYRSILLNAGKLNVGIAKLGWERKYEKVFDINVKYTDIDKFTADFPDYKKAGLTESEYQSTINKLKTDSEVTIPRIQHLQLTYNLPEIENVNRDKFILIPSNAKSIESARGHGYEMELSWNDLKKGEAEGRYHNIDRVMKSAGVSYEDSIVDRERNSEEKKKNEQTTDYKKIPYNAYKIIYNYDIDDDGLTEKLIFTYLYKEGIIIKVEYWDENLFFVPHYIELRPGRFDGIGVVKSTEPMNDNADKIWNLRNNVARMVCSPSFKAKIGSSFDPTAQEFYPGVVFWLENPDDVEQWVLINNFPELYNEEILLDKYIQQRTGVTAGQMGRESASDPNAPASKTIALIQESNILINDDIACLRDGIEEVYYRIIQMCAKYLPEDDKYLIKYGLKKEDLKVSLDEIFLNGISASINKETRREEEMRFYAMYSQDPLIATDPQTKRKMLKNVFASWGRDKEALLPTELEVFEALVKVETEALKRFSEETLERKEQAEKAGQMGIPNPEEIPESVAGEM